MPVNYESVIYPQGLDYFQEVFDRDDPDNVVHAYLVNKLQNALQALQTHTLYSARGMSASGPVLCTVALLHEFTTNTGSKKHRLRFELEPELADQFGGTPFHRDHGVIPSVTAYRIQNGQRSYHRVQCAFEPVTESERFATLACFKGGREWLRGDILEAQLLLINV